MGIINSQTFGLMRPDARVTARNAHLMPEIHQRIKRILQSAKEEEIMSVSTLKVTAELWSQLKSGQPCICGQIEKDCDECKTVNSGIPDLIEFLRSDNRTILNNKEFCSLCYGTGFVGGYRKAGTYDILLHGNDPSLKLYNNLSLQCGRPYTIRVGTSGTAEWTVQLPKYYIRTDTIVLKWKNRPPYKYNLLLNGEDFDLDTFNLLGQMSSDSVKISLYIEDTSGQVELEYIRIMLTMNRNNMVMVDAPNPVMNYTGEVLVSNEVQSTVTLNFDGRQNIETTDIVFFEKNGVGYRITEVERNSPLDVTISNNCQARLIRSFENYYILPSKVAHQMYPMPNFTFLY